MLTRFIVPKNLRRDRFATVAAIVAVALSTATVNSVLILDASTRLTEAEAWAANPDLEVRADTVEVRGLNADGALTRTLEVKEETHEDYEVMRSAIRLGSFTAFAVGIVVVFFTFSTTTTRRRREIALFRSLGVTASHVARLILTEALVIGGVGASLGLIGSVFLAAFLARAGITTTGRANIAWADLTFPWTMMLVVAAVGGVTTVLGAVPPIRELMTQSVTSALRPDGLRSGPIVERSRKTFGTMMLLAVPLMLLLYLLLRPFLKTALPSLTFFVFEGMFTVTSFVAFVLLVPGVIALLGKLIGRTVSGGTSAVQFLARARVVRQPRAYSFAVGGVMAVCSLVLALHISTDALRREVGEWGDRAVKPCLFLMPGEKHRIPESFAQTLPPELKLIRFSGRTAWPNHVYATNAAELDAWAQANGDPEIVRASEAFGPGSVIVSTLMARTHQVDVGGFLEIAGRGGKKRLLIVAVTDGLGFSPAQGPYRQMKTYALIDWSDAEIIRPYTTPLGTAAVIVDPTRPGVAPGDNPAMLSARIPRYFRPLSGPEWVEQRQRGTARDFVIFDIILGLTTLLAAVGVASHMTLSLMRRRTELGLYRVLGMSAQGLRKLVLAEGALIGLIGGVLAVLLGIPLGYAAIGVLKAVSAFEVDFAVPIWYIPATIVGAFAVCFCASLRPAARVARVNVAESVHYAE